MTQNPTTKPTWLIQKDDDYYGPGEEFVMFPVDAPNRAILDGAFTPQMLRDIASWIEGANNDA